MQKYKTFGEEICVKARIARMTGISGHADREGLVRWVSHIAPKPTHVFVVHGEDTVTDSFASLLTTTYGINATAPYTGESWDLLSDQKFVKEQESMLRRIISQEKAG